jgi:hypothetical protein
MKEIKLDPICFKKFSMAVTNTGYLLPCCYCDDIYTFEDIEFQKLMAASKIDEHETLEEIVFSKEWKDFEENLRNHKGPPCCIQICQVRKNTIDVVRKDTWINPDNGTVERVRNV